MIFVKPEVTSYNEVDLQKKIERCFRMCYKSEDKITEGSEAFLTNPIHTSNPNKHWSPLEHARITIKIDHDIFDALYTWKEYNVSLISPIEFDTSNPSYPTVTTNFRTLLEFITYPIDSDSDYEYGTYCYAKDALASLLSKHYPYIFKAPKEEPANLPDFKIEEAKDYQTFQIVTTRDILQEFARHRSLSFSVESTRYCNYNKRGMTFTLPEPYSWSDDVVEGLKNKSLIEYLNDRRLLRGCRIAGDGSGYSIVDYNFKETINAAYCIEDLYILNTAIAEQMYNKALNLGAKPQEARMLLPGGLKTEMMVTGTFKAWKHFIDLRDNVAAHPQICILAKAIKTQLDLNHPGWDGSLH